MTYPSESEDATTEPVTTILPVTTTETVTSAEPTEPVTSMDITNKTVCRVSHVASSCLQTQHPIPTSGIRYMNNLYIASP